jgi:OOP family OmpA-OmpF porin
MKNLHFLVLFVMTLVMAFVPGTPQAAVRPDTLNLTPFGGYYFFEGKQRFKDRPVFGLAAGYNFTERWGMEGVASYINGEVDEGPEDTVDIYSVSLDALYHFQPNRPLVPYMAVGIGWMGFYPGGSGNSETRGRFNYGLGLKYFVTDDVALRADVRHILTDGDMDKNDKIYNNLSCTFGVTFQLGPFDSRGRSSKKPAATWDTDGDGVPDQFDRCPNTQPGLNVDGFGCAPVTAPVAK